MASIELQAGRAVGLTCAVWLAVAGVGGCAPLSPGPGPARASAEPQFVSAEPPRSLPTLEEERAAKRERELSRARTSGLPTLEEELRAKQAREGSPPAATPAAEPRPEPDPPPPAPQAEPGPASAEEFLPPWWVEGVDEGDGVVSAAGKGEAGSLVEARRFAVDEARAKIRGTVGASGSVDEAPVNSAAVRLADGRYRAFVLMRGRP